MSLRRQSRERVMQVLYELDQQNKMTSLVLADAISVLNKQKKANPESLPYATALLEGIVANLQNIDETISRHSKHWRLDRIAPIERSLLRMAVFEMQYSDGTPIEVALNEAIEIAKKFAAEESPRFLNGVLDAIARELS